LTTKPEFNLDENFGSGIHLAKTIQNKSSLYEIFTQKKFHTSNNLQKREIQL